MSHALLSPSGAKRWTSCTASPSQEVGKRDSSNEASRQGTAEHLVSSECLDHGLDPAVYLGKTVVFCVDIIDGTRSFECFEGEQPDTVVVANKVLIDEASVARCQAYVNFVRDVVESTGGMLMVEQRLSIEHITGEAGAKGTADAVILAGDTLIVIDAKFGSGRINAWEKA